MTINHLTCYPAWVGLPEHYLGSRSNQLSRTFIGIAVHNATSAGTHHTDLASGVRQDASGILGTTTMLSDLVCAVSYHELTSWLTMGLV